MKALDIEGYSPTPPDERLEFLQFLEENKRYLCAGGRWTPVAPNRFSSLIPSDLTDEEKSSLRLLAAQL